MEAGPYRIVKRESGRGRWDLTVLGPSGRILLLGRVHGEEALERTTKSLADMTAGSPEAQWRLSRPRVTWELLRRGRVIAALTTAGTPVVAVLAAVLVVAAAGWVWLQLKNHPAPAGTDLAQLLPLPGALGADWSRAIEPRAPVDAAPALLAGAADAKEAVYQQSGSQFAMEAEMLRYPDSGSAQAAVQAFTTMPLTSTADKDLSVAGVPAHLRTTSSPSAGCEIRYVLSWRDQNLVGVITVDWQGGLGPDASDTNPCSIQSALGSGFVQRVAEDQVARAKPLTGG